MAEDRLEGLAGGFAPTTPCPLLIRPVRPLPNGRIPPLQEDKNQYPLLKDIHERTPSLNRIFTQVLTSLKGSPQYCSEYLNICCQT